MTEQLVVQELQRDESQRGNAERTGVVHRTRGDGASDAAEATRHLQHQPRSCF